MFRYEVLYYFNHYAKYFDKYKQFGQNSCLVFIYSFSIAGFDWFLLITKTYYICFKLEHYFNLICVTQIHKIFILIHISIVLLFDNINKYT